MSELRRTVRRREDRIFDDGDVELKIEQILWEYMRCFIEETRCFIVKVKVKLKVETGVR